MDKSNEYGSVGWMQSIHQNKTPEEKSERAKEIQLFLDAWADFLNKLPKNLAEESARRMGGLVEFRAKELISLKP